eukprot:SAG25_NODE_3078_length_1228_cov_1.131089_2_plen_140_part_01
MRHSPTIRQTLLDGAQQGGAGAGSRHSPDLWLPSSPPARPARAPAGAGWTGALGLTVTQRRGRRPRQPQPLQGGLAQPCAPGSRRELGVVRAAGQEEDEVTSRSALHSHPRLAEPLLRVGQLLHPHSLPATGFTGQSLAC